MCHTEIPRVVGDHVVPSVPQPDVANVHLVLLDTQAVVEGQLAHFWGQRHEGHIPTGTSVAVAAAKVQNITLNAKKKYEKK